MTIKNRHLTALTTHISKIVKKEHFSPGILGCFINPFFILRRGIHRGIKRNAPQLSGRLLDFGCGSKPYRDLFRVDQYIGLDIEQSGHPKDEKMADIYYDGKTIPFRDSSFDSVFATEVLEHVFNLPEILREINRVLRKDGKFLITIPFAWFEHEAPYDFARYTSYGIRHVLENHGFEIMSEEKTTDFFSAMAQMFILYLRIAVLTSEAKALKAVWYLFVFAPVTIFGLLFSKVLPKNHDYYLTNVILSKKITDIAT